MAKHIVRTLVPKIPNVMEAVIILVTSAVIFLVSVKDVLRLVKPNFQCKVYLCLQTKHANKFQLLFDHYLEDETKQIKARLFAWYTK